MIFKVTDYRKRKDSNDIFYSPSFYTSPNGYHVKIKVDANGNGEYELEASLVFS